METSDFFRLVSAFAENPEAVQRQGNHFVLQTSEDELIDADLHRRDGLFVEEKGVSTSALRWITRRLAKLDRLAERIRATIAQERTKAFVTPSGRLIDDLAHSAAGNDVPVPDAVATLDSIVDRRPAGLSTILYLTSNAGEGKTTVIDELALRRAELFQSGSSDWLLVPIALAGKPFIRFDDIIVATLANRFRFLALYYLPFIELVRKGVIVPAFDGFEEMFVESSSGEAVSALGSLLSDLKGEGTVVIAARSAYFEYRRLDTQAKLFDSIGNIPVSFSRLSIDRWTREHFVKYCVERGLTEAEANQLHSAVALRFSVEHPILTRPVLAKRLVDFIEDGASIDELLAKLGYSATDYFSQFVAGIVEREAQKWLDKSPGPREPILSVLEHEELLSTIAREMWTSRAEAVGADVLETLAQIFCDSHRIAPARARQVLERIKDHSLIRESAGAKRQFAFDHDEFFQFFLGRSLSLAVRDETDSDVRDILRRGLLPTQSVREALADLRRRGFSTAVAIVERITACVGSEPALSFARENAGDLVRALLGEVKATERVIIRDLIFGTDTLKGVNWANICFVGCTFGATSMQGARLSDIEFQSCSFQDIELASDCSVFNVTISSDTQIYSVVPEGWDTAVYAPEAKLELLRRAGIGVKGQMELVPSPADVTTEPDERLRAVERAVRTFFRGTEINEDVFRMRLGNQATQFFDTIVPHLLDAGVLEEVPYRGRGHQRRYRLRCPLQELRVSLENSKGDYDAFIRDVRGRAIGRLTCR
jgi:hypothetical protein